MFHLIVSVKTCAKVNADHASADPDQTDYDYNTDVTYSCDLAYNHTAGNLTRTCNASAEWTGTLPTCESKTTLMCLNYGTPKYYLFSICNKWKINFFRCPDSLYQHGKSMVLGIFNFALPTNESKTALMCFNFGTPKIIYFRFRTNGKLTVFFFVSQYCTVFKCESKTTLMCFDSGTPKNH